VETLSRRALNRALLQRQGLLQRSDLPVVTALERLVGLQAQAPNAPYIGLWTRLTAFHAEALAELIVERSAVRAPLMRGTIHLVTAPDCLVLWPVVEPARQASFMATPFGRNLAGLEIDAVIEAGCNALERMARTRAELGLLLAQRWPDRDPISLAYAVTYLTPVVQAPPRGVWGANGQATWTTVESRLGRRPDSVPDLDAMILRYLAAFGPASVADMQWWSGVRGLRLAVERLRSRLRVFEDETGRELFDVPNAPLPDPNTLAPPRFLPEYDNVLLGHANRKRILPANNLPPLPPGRGGVKGTVLIDGFFGATWKIEMEVERAKLVINPLEPLSSGDTEAVTAEGEALLAFAAPDAAAHAVAVMSPRR
jgi:Winged helix DNA-binding domain